uniref:PDZ domain-containing protein n=1 Tax=Eptatretus burgeri TaxID=7764 RepID=A0A8C4QDP4_EPTBU
MSYLFFPLFVSSGDRLMEVDGCKRYNPLPLLVNFTPACAIEESTSPTNNLALSGRPSKNVFEVTLEKSVNGLGFSFMGDKEPWTNSESCDVVRIKRLFTGYPAESCHKIQPGDVILRVNGIPLRGLSHQAVLSVLRGTGPIVTLKLCRPDPGILPSINPDLTVCTSPSTMHQIVLDLKFMRNNGQHISG